MKRDRRQAVLLDQHPLWLEAVERLLGALGFDVVGKTVLASEALALIRGHVPDLFVAEISTPSGDIAGLGCVRQAVEYAPEMKTIVLSSYDDADHIDQVLSTGAAAYVVKTAHPEDFASAVRQAFTHSIYLSGMPLHQSATNGAGAVETAELTRREVEILLLVAEGLSNAELARRLWVTEQTVKFHLSNIYRKLDVSNRTEASRWAQIHGLLPSGAVQTTAA